MYISRSQVGFRATFKLTPEQSAALLAAQEETARAKKADEYATSHYDEKNPLASLSTQASVYGKEAHYRGLVQETLRPYFNAVAFAILQKLTLMFTENTVFNPTTRTLTVPDVSFWTALKALFQPKPLQN
jgi:hypothetical protein